MDRVLEAKKFIEKKFFGSPNIVGVAIANNKVIVFVRGKVQLPSKVMGVDVEIVDVGEITILPEVQSEETVISRRGRVRPLVGGVSVGRGDLPFTGTLGAIVVDALGTPYILSNNHVLALHWGKVNFAFMGAPVIQPGRVDHGRMPEDLVAKLWRWASVIVNRVNLVDAALAKVLPDVEFKVNDVLHDTKHIELNGLTDVDVGDKVCKSGRSTGTTCGEVVAKHATVAVTGFGTCVFTDQLIVKIRCDRGDSGSIVYTEDGKFVGLLFAGSPQRQLAVVNRAINVVRALGLRRITKVIVPITPIRTTFTLLPTIVGLLTAMKATKI